MFNKVLILNCSSGGAGGGIYIRNIYESYNQVTFTDLNITDCQAQYRGGIYAYSHYKVNVVT